MPVVAIVCHFVLIGYVVILIYEARETRGHLPNTPKQAKWTVCLFFLSDVIAIGGGLIEYHLAVEQIDTRISVAGMALIVGKVLLKRWAMKALGRHYNVHIVVSESQELVKSGPYKYVRHPAYLAHFLSILGIPLMLNAFRTLLIASTFDLIPLFVRIKFEERELVKTFGEEYLAYRKKTYGLLPLGLLFARLQGHRK